MRVGEQQCDDSPTDRSDVIRVLRNVERRSNYDLAEEVQHLFGVPPGGPVVDGLDSSGQFDT